MSSVYCCGCSSRGARAAMLQDRDLYHWSGASTFWAPPRLPSKLSRTWARSTVTCTRSPSEGQNVWWWIVLGSSKKYSFRREATSEDGRISSDSTNCSEATGTTVSKTIRDWWPSRVETLNGWISAKVNKCYIISHKLFLTGKQQVVSSLTAQFPIRRSLTITTLTKQIAEFFTYLHIY